MRRLAAGFLGLSLASLAGCDGAPATENPQSKASPACQPAIFEGISLTHCVADPAMDRIRTVLDGPDGAPLRSLDALKQSLPTGAAVKFAMNGGMYDEDGKPIGYYVERGVRRHTLNRKQGAGNFHLLPNGVFYATGGSWHVRTSDDFAEHVTTRPDFATQSGPMLVIGGKLHPEFDDDGPSLKVRNAVGVDRAGRAHFVISEQPISFGKFARYFRDELHTPNALFLDGSVSQLWDPATERLDDLVPLGPLIVVERLR